MASKRSNGKSPRRRRLNPDDRRQEIVDAARPLFAERPFTQITTADVAEAAGVARTLVHHYFGGIRNVFLAVIAEGGAALANVRTVGPPTPLEQRLNHNIPATMDVVVDNRETWLAVMGHRHSVGDEQIDDITEAATAFNIQRSLENNSDLVPDTPLGRAAIRCLLILAREATRLWLDGHFTREQAEAFIITTWRNTILHSIPAAESATQGSKSS